MDFTHTSYKQMLHALATAGYTFSRFPQAPTNMAWATPFVLLRHDVDLDLEAALAMAHIEAEMGIASTYFVMVRTQFYNVFSQAGSHYVRTILDLGHDIGLHFDCAAYPRPSTRTQTFWRRRAGKKLTCWKAGLATKWKP